MQKSQKCRRSYAKGLSNIWGKEWYPVKDPEEITCPILFSIIISNINNYCYYTLNYILKRYWKWKQRKRFTYITISSTIFLLNKTLYSRSFKKNYKKSCGCIQPCMHIHKIISSVATRNALLSKKSMKLFPLSRKLHLFVKTISI